MARYDAVADFYQQVNPDLASDAVAAALLRLNGPVDGHRVLDLACGAGRAARALAARGARVTGLDLSAALLAGAAAAERDEPLGIACVHGWCADPDVLAGACLVVRCVTRGRASGQRGDA